MQKNNKQFTYGQTVQKNNKQLTYGQTVQKNNNNNLHMDRQCKKNNKQFTYGQTVQKKQQTIYIWTDSLSATHYTPYGHIYIMYTIYT